ncbi:MAG TPA: hypothetical protein VNZ52_12410 [Candidatus Thermoplasmatota archaeon]|nr:hypothetical protein [Candidatus Thermoplasmatota archaeon]
MNKTTVFLVLGALLMVPLAAAQDNYPEPNTGFDTATGALTPTSAAASGTVEYFDMYVYCDTPGFAPREATGGRFICPGTVRYSLVWGQWNDANKDGCIGSCGALVVAGSSTDGAFKSVAPVTRVYAAGNLNNDGNYQVEKFIASGDVDDLTQNEYRPIGPSDAAHQPSNLRPIGASSVGTNAFQVHDPQAVAWLDFRAPGQGAGTRCLVPMARGTFATVEGMYTYVDDFTFDRLSGNGLGADNLGIDGNNVNGVDVSLIWLADDVERAYNSSESDNTDKSSHDSDTGVAPTFDRFYHENLAGVLGPSNRPTYDYIAYQDLEQDGCNGSANNFPNQPEGRFVYTAGIYLDVDGDGNMDTVVSGAGWASDTQIIFSPVGAHPLGTLTNGAWYNTAYGYRSGLGGKAGLAYTGVSATSTVKDMELGIPWYNHPVSWRDADCLDDTVARGQNLPTHALLANAARC